MSELKVVKNFVVADTPRVDAIAVVTYKHANKEELIKGRVLDPIFVSRDQKSVAIRLPKSLDASEINISFFTLEKKHEKVPGKKGYPKKSSEYADTKVDPHKFPVDDKKHVHAAIAYFSKGHFKSSGEKKSTARKILAAAKKHGVKVSESSDVYKAAHGG